MTVYTPLFVFIVPWSSECAVLYDSLVVTFVVLVSVYYVDRGHIPQGTCVKVIILCLKKSGDLTPEGELFVKMVWAVMRERVQTSVKLLCVVSDTLESKGYLYIAHVLGVEFTKTCLISS